MTNPCGTTHHMGGSYLANWVDAVSLPMDSSYGAWSDLDQTFHP